MAQVITTVDASTFDVYLKNMKSLFMEMAKDSDLIIFNRSTDDTPAASYKREICARSIRKRRLSLKKRTVPSWNLKRRCPSTWDADIIDISDIDYGIWYIDAMDHPEKYDGENRAFQGYGICKQEPAERIFCAGTHGHDLLRGRYRLYRIPLQIFLCRPSEIQTVGHSDGESDGGRAGRNTAEGKRASSFILRISRAIRNRKEELVYF